MTFQIISGLLFDQSIELPDGSKIVAADWAKQPAWNEMTGRHFTNHSVFRLDKDGNVLWQIRRDEGTHTGWAKSREDAEARNEREDHWTYSPFSVLWLRWPDGSTNVNPTTYKFPEVDCWVEEVTVMCSTLDSRRYELDIETGVARCVDAPTRPW